MSSILDARYSRKALLWRSQRTRRVLLISCHEKAQKNWAREITESTEYISICIYTYGLYHDRSFYTQILSTALRTGNADCADLVFASFGVFGHGFARSKPAKGGRKGRFCERPGLIRRIIFRCPIWEAGEKGVLLAAKMHEKGFAREIAESTECISICIYTYGL